MCVESWISETNGCEAVRPGRRRRAFTLLEVLVVITIIGILIGAMGGVINNSFRKARESATTALLLKIEGLLDERIKGFERATKSRDFQRIVTLRKQALDSAGLFGVSPKVIEAVARKDFYRANFPQRFNELPPNTTSVPAFSTSGVPSIILGDSQITYIAANHNRVTESSALLYYMLTKMQVFGVPPVGESEFSTSEVRDTDGDGLLEFVDGWGRPLRFYRWPTRMFKPAGVGGRDFKNGVKNFDDDGNGVNDNTAEIEWPGTDDVFPVPSSKTYPLSNPLYSNIRDAASLLIDGLPSAPVVAGQWDSLNADPEDPYGLIWTEILRLAYTGIDVTAGPAGYNEPLYPTLDTYHTPLIVSAGADGILGMYEPYDAGDALFGGTGNLTHDYNGDGVIDCVGVLGQIQFLFEDANVNGVMDSGEDSNGNGTLDWDPYVIPNGVISALSDNLTNRNRRAGRGK